MISISSLSVDYTVIIFVELKKTLVEQLNKYTHLFLCNIGTNALASLKGTDGKLRSLLNTSYHNASPRLLFKWPWVTHTHKHCCFSGTGIKGLWHTSSTGSNCHSDPWAAAFMCWKGFIKCSGEPKSNNIFILTLYLQPKTSNDARW